MPHRFLVILLVLWFAGCSSRKATEVASNPAVGGGGPGGGAPGGNNAAVVSSMRLDLRTKSLGNLKNLGIAYYTAIASGSLPRSANELKAYVEGGDRFFKSPYNDNRPYEFAWGLDPAKLQGSSATTLLAWEPSADSDGGRCVLLANGNAQYVSAAEFATLQKPAGR